MFWIVKKLNIEFRTRGTSYSGYIPGSYDEGQNKSRFQMYMISVGYNFFK